jgi:ABC-type antimicrobial peptide transport system permease subunit
VIASLRRDVAAIDASAAFHPMPFTEWTGVTLLPQKVAASMMGALGLISLILAGVGLYSVIAYAVAQRTHEIGIRMALGARSAHVLADVLRRGLLMTFAGIAAGLAVAVITTRLIASMLVDVSALDPVAFVGAALFLMAVALLATWVPARRATKIDPAVAFRCD